MQILNFKKNRMSLYDLWRLIFKYTFDKKSCGYSTQSVINDHIMSWYHHIEEEKKKELQKYGLSASFTAIGRKGSILDEHDYQIKLMSDWVVKEEGGFFEKRVMAYERAKIDYRLAEPMCKVFPECSKLRDFKSGIQALKKAMKDNPEDYK